MPLGTPNAAFAALLPMNILLCSSFGLVKSQRGFADVVMLTCANSIMVAVSLFLSFVPSIGVTPIPSPHDYEQFRPLRDLVGQ